MAKTAKNYDVIVIGGGPTGLAFALSLAKADMRVCVLEKETVGVLAKPAPDGRDTALTHASMKILDDLGVLAHVQPQNISPIREARVLDGSSSSYFLNFAREGKKGEALGHIIGNHIIRKAAYDAVKKQGGIALETGAEVSDLEIKASVWRRNFG